MAKVLHLDDEEDWRNYIAKLLEANGHSVTSCRSVSHAESEDRFNGPFDIYICDSNVQSWWDGAHFAGQLHGQGKKVIGLSGGDTCKGISFIDKRNPKRDTALLKVIEELLKPPSTPEVTKPRTKRAAKRKDVAKSTP